ncbi:hypothetical protein AGIG_G6266 [Arapaima gigas]
MPSFTTAGPGSRRDGGSCSFPNGKDKLTAATQRSREVRRRRRVDPSDVDPTCSSVRLFSGRLQPCRSCVEAEERGCSAAVTRNTLVRTTRETQPVPRSGVTPELPDSLCTKASDSDGILDPREAGV